jgi:hypothetical protein
LEAGFHRRDQDWKHQVEVAKRELTQIDKQITAAEIRRDIAVRSYEVHQRSIDQTQEAFEFMRDRFSNFGRFTWLSAELQKLNRMAFNAALAMARLAEKAYRFERPDEAGPLLSESYWDAGNAGLLAGDRLLLDLQQLERRFIETNYRTLEIEQSFSLAQLAPLALLSLRELGSCEFTVPEAAFDLTYPGHYRRRIKAVRISVPCVAGPYLNVGATLRLTGSRLRQDPRLADTLTEVPLGHTTAIATSGAQSDAGVFEFSFRDERFMPFEGAGAVSDWGLELPATFRAFDYRTISDVILRVSYTAEQNDELKAEVEKAAAAAAGTLRHRLDTDGMPLLFSMRHDFPDAWRRLITAPVGTIVPVELSERHLPAILANWLRGRAVTTPKLSIGSWAMIPILQSAAALTAIFSAGLGLLPAPALLKFDPITGMTGLYQAKVTGDVILEPAASSATLRLRLDAANTLAPAPGSVPAVTIDETKLCDMMIVAAVTTK